MKLRRFVPVAALFVAAAGAVDRPASAQAAMEASAVETVATFPGGEAYEALTELPDGSFIVVANFASKLLRVTPDGKISNFAELPAHPQVVVQSKDGFVVTAHARLPEGFGGRGRGPGAAPPAGAPAAPGVAAEGGAPPAGGQPGPGAAPAAAPGGFPAGFATAFVDRGTQVIVLDKDGKVVKTITGEKDQFFNGLTPLKNFYLAADSIGTTLWKIDAANGEITPWLQDPLLGNPKGGFGGANGLKANGDWVYVTVTARNAMYRVRVDSKGNPQGALAVYAENVGGDDFGVTKDGTTYDPTGSKIVKIAPDGTQSILVDNVAGGPAAIVSRDGKWLYWLTRGPMPTPGSAPNAGRGAAGGPFGAGPALMVRIRIQP